MQPRCREPVHVLDRVVHAVEAPQHGDRVREPVPDVATHCSEDDALDELEPAGLRGDHRRGERDDHHAQDHERDRDCGDEADVDQAPGHQEVHEVAAPPGS